MTSRRGRVSLALLTILLLVLAASCGSSDSDSGSGTTTTTGSGDDGSDGEVFEGHYSTGFEVNAFVECGADEQWWVVDGTGELAEQATGGETGRQEYELVFARVRGTLSEPGTYGHLGAYSRELEVTEVLEASPDGSC